MYCNETEPELLGASTKLLNAPVREKWIGANPDVLHVTNPNEGAIPVRLWGELSIFVWLRI